jgi:hypothetical protein
MRNDERAFARPTAKRSHRHVRRLALIPRFTCSNILLHLLSPSYSSRAKSIRFPCHVAERFRVTRRLRIHRAIGGLPIAPLRQEPKMSRHAYLFGPVMIAGMAIGCCNVPCPPEHGACNACSSGECHTWHRADGGYQGNCWTCSTSNGAKGQNIVQPQSAPSNNTPENRSAFAADQLNRPEATPTSRPRTLPSTEANQSPLPPLVPPRPPVELPPVQSAPDAGKATANKQPLPLPSGLSTRPTTPYGQVMYTPY